MAANLGMRGFLPRWCRKPPAASRVGRVGVKERGNRGRTKRGTGGASPRVDASPRAHRPGARRLLSMWSERATLPMGVHPLAIGHPPGSGLGPAGEGGSTPPSEQTYARGAKSLLGPCAGRWREDEPLPPSPTLTVAALALPQSILELLNL